MLLTSFTIFLIGCSFAHSSPVDKFEDLIEAVNDAKYSDNVADLADEAEVDRSLVTDLVSIVENGEHDIRDTSEAAVDVASDRTLLQVRIAFLIETILNSFAGISSEQCFEHQPPRTWSCSSPRGRLQGGQMLQHSKDCLLLSEWSGEPLARMSDCQPERMLPLHIQFTISEILK